MTISIARDYSKTPGGRFKKEGSFSGEDFRERVLLPAYNLAKEKDKILEVNLDGGYGYGSSFLEEAFGGLVRQIRSDDVIKRILIISNEEPRLIDNIKGYMEDALNEKA